jgi:hypothetical protein
LQALIAPCKPPNENAAVTSDSNKCALRARKSQAKLDIN